MTWSARACTQGDHPIVLDFFAEPDFYFRTPIPDLLSSAEIVALLDEDTRLLSADGEPVGLYAWQSLGGVSSSHYQLDLRLRHDVPDEEWAAAYQELVRALRWGTDVVRVTVLAGEFDPRWVKILLGLGLSDDGVLEGIVLHHGRRCGYHRFGHVWTVVS